MSAGERYFYPAAGERFLEILNAGTITLEDADAGPDECLPISWCNSGSDHLDLREGVLEIMEGLFRIEIPLACVPITWPEYRRLHRLDTKVMRWRLKEEEDYLTHRTRCSPYLWRGSLIEIPRDHWLGIEQLVGNKWERVDNPREAIEFWNPGKEGEIDATDLKALLRIGA